MHALIVSLMLSAAPARAGAWADFKAIFPALPCHDGWAGCIVDGNELGPDMVPGTDGIPMPVGLRLDWFSLQATPALSPFVALSDYQVDTAQLAQVAEAPASPEAGQDAVADAGGPTPEPEERDPVEDPVEPRIDRDPEPRDPGRQPVAVVDPPPVQPRQPGSAYVPPPEPRPGAQAVQPPPAEPVRPPPVEPIKPIEVAPVRPPPVEPVKPTAKPPVEVPPVAMAPVQEVDNSCDDLVALEPAALMGQLTPGQRECLEARIVSASRMTEKDKVSRVLILDAETKGDKANWERLIKRHLEDIDRSDPDLCFKYAIFLSRKGVGRAQGVIRWADYALENKAKWQGSSFVSRVNSLLKLKAEAANNLWKAAEEAYVQDRNDEKEAEAARFRDLTKVYAREWLDYARVSGQDTKNAMALCVSASGNKQYCEGG